MAWRETERSLASPVRRTYSCTDCLHQWKVQCMSGDPDPECPNCEKVEPSLVFEPVAVLGVKSKAIDVAQKMAEQTFGLTDFNDNSRPGDIAAKAPPPVQTAEAEAIVQSMVEMGMTTAAAGEAAKEQVQSFWQGGGQMPPEAAMSLARASKDPKSVDPVAVMNAAGKSGLDPLKNLAVHGRAKLEVTA